MLKKYVEKMCIKFFFRKNEKENKNIFGCGLNFRKLNLFRVYNFIFVRREDYFFVNFKQDDCCKFINYQYEERFFDKVDCINIVQYICFNIFFGEKKEGEVGLRKLIYCGVYKVGYLFYDDFGDFKQGEKFSNDR